MYLIFFCKLSSSQYFYYINFTATGPIIENEPQNSTVLEGNEVILSCRVIGAPKPNTTWTFGGMFL